MASVKRLYPLLFVFIPILNVAARNPGGATVTDVLALSLSMVLVWAVLYGVAALALRRRPEKAAVPLLMLVAVLLFYAYPTFRAAYNDSRGAPGRLIVTVGVFLTVITTVIVGVRWLARRPALRERVDTFFGVMGLLLIAFLGAQVARDQWRARSQLRNSDLAGELARPLSVKSPPVTGVEPLRDIYLLILDEYANSSVLRERFGYDNRPFEDSLQRLGFTIPRLVRSNYAHTLLSIPSLLNFSYLTDLSREPGVRETDPTIPNHLVEHSRTASFLKSRGYRFVFYPSQWWISTERNRNADSTFQAWHGFQPARELTESDLRRAFVSRTPLALLQRGDPYDADHVKRTLGAVAQLPAEDRPTFALAHILNPHYPYVFDAACQPHRTRPNRSWGRGREEDYLRQLECLNRLLLGALTQLLQHSAIEPIILIVGDHGTNSLGYSEAPSARAVSPDQARERFGAFGAFRLPAGGNRNIPDTVTLVNLIPAVLNYYFDAGLNLAPDSLYMSLEKTPYMFAPVDPLALTPH